MKWYRLTFRNTCWMFDNSVFDDDVFCATVSNELFGSGLNEILSDKSGLSEILINMKKKGHISSITYTVNSDILGPNTVRNEYLFPQEVYIPTNHDLEVGKLVIDLIPRVVSIKTCRYISSGKIEIGIAALDPGTLPLLRGAKGGCFLGCMDNDPFGLIKPRSSQPTTAIAKPPTK